METVLIENLRKSYGKVKAVDGISFTVQAGEVFGMLGPNGAGKTTTVEIMVGIRNRDSGHVTVLGLDPRTSPQAVKARVGVQLQSTELYPRLTTLEVLRLFGSFYPRPADPEAILDLVGLAEKRQSLVMHLSGGQVQRLALGTALVGDAQVVFLDEPTTGLDPQARLQLWEVIRKFKEMGKTVFLTTHYMEEAERLCDRVAIIDHGRIIALGSPRALVAEHFSERAIEFRPQAGGAPADFAHLPAVTRAERQGEMVILYTRQVAPVLESILASPGTNGGGIADITVRQATLEDVFIKLTGRRMRE
ncbi:MAG TPA: ABC transporter ATP-binding protein [Bacillota bacterium]|nr:ABC transporter ATP-binding protein [Bacillota bacterium]